MLCGFFVIFAALFVLPVSAESAASKVDMYCTVNNDGDCLVSMTVTLRMEASDEGLTFPLPYSASSITMNGSSVSTSRVGDKTLAALSRVVGGLTGEFTVRFDYVLPKAVSVTADRQLQLTLPMLCGFDYPVESLSFIITLPDNIETKPTFTSTYQQNGFESNLELTITGNMITGASVNTLNDHEAVTMTMAVSKDMFPTVSTYVRDGYPELPYILGFFGTALLYWLLTLRTWPIHRSRASTAPEGITAGELGCRLTLTGGDLTMMVFSWAQLGYLLIAVEGSKVYLHKRMDMGNERSAFENKVFNLLFGRRQAVDATGNQYAALCRKVAGMVPMERNMYRGNSGNMKIFRLLGCLAQGACGVCVAMNMSPVLALAVVMAVVLCFIGWISGWLMQDVAYCTHLRGKVPVAIGLVILIVWTLLGLLSGQVWIPLGCTLGQWVLGFFAAYGGRRSDLGRHDAGQVLGLRSYLKHLPRDGINRLLQNDPDYFFNMAPYALALGIIRPYADTFGRRKLEHCPYLFTRNDTGRRTAQEWGELMRSTALKMDARAKQMRIERWFAVPLPKPKRR